MFTRLTRHLNNFSLKAKLLLSFSLIVFGIVLVTIYAVQSIALNHSKNLLIDNINISQHVITEHIADVASVINKAATNLSSDFTLKTLILNASDDEASLNLALKNFAERFDTPEFALFTSSGKAITRSEEFSLESMQNLANFSQPEGGWIAMNDSYYLISAVAVKNTPLSRDAMAWLVFAKPIEALFDSQVSQLTNLEVSAIAWHSLDQGRVLSSSMDKALTQDIFDKRKLIRDDLYTSEIAEQSFFGTIVSLVEQPPLKLSIMLYTPEEKAFLSYSSLLKQLIFLLLFATVLVLGFALIFSNSLSLPLVKLSEVASNIGEGEEAIDVPKGNTRELNNLSKAISNMHGKLSKRNKEIYTLAFTDMLTKLPNRTALYEFIDKRLTTDKYEQFSLIVLDISRFTDINEAIGYESGDTLLISIAKRLSLHFQNELMLARISGNQFALLLGDNRNIVDTTEQLRSCIQRPFEINNLTFGVSAKFGCAHLDTTIKNARALAQSADIALKIAKTSYSPYVVFDPSLNLFDAKKLSLMADLPHIARNGQLSLHYQPQLCLTDDKIKSVECLARWTHPEHGFIPPDIFIEMAEQSGQIKNITRFVIEQAIVQHCKWRIDGFDIQVAVNISAIDLADTSFTDYVVHILHQHGVNPNRLLIEVTESTAMEDPELAMKALLLLSRIGVKLSIDDFGTGYSSMAQLKKMPVKELKIDKAFVLQLASDSEDQVMVSTFIALANNLCLNTVAEGVEDEASLTLLKEMGCTYAQGYFISRPLNGSAMSEWLVEKQDRCLKVNLA